MKNGTIETARDGVSSSNSKPSQENPQMTDKDYKNYNIQQRKGVATTVQITPGVQQAALHIVEDWR